MDNDIADSPKEATKHTYLEVDTQHLKVIKTAMYNEIVNSVAVLGGQSFIGESVNWNEGYPCTNQCQEDD